MKTEIKETAKELGFVPKYEPLTPEGTEQFMKILLSEPKEGAEESMIGDEAPFPIKILNSRIEALELPISFDFKGKLLALIYTDGNPGKIVTLLIDCLTKFEGQTIDQDKIVDVYPYGFYTEDSFMDLIDNYFKKRKVKWSELY